MQTTNVALLDTLNSLLQPEKVRDYCPNGLQVEGKTAIKRLMTGVTASQALIDSAVAWQADAILVHHGYFWKNENPVVTGMKRQRLKTLLAADINLFAYHLPLDVHPELGNNAQLAKRLGIVDASGLEAGNPTSVAMRGRFADVQTLDSLANTIHTSLERMPMVEKVNDKPLSTVAWCTGGGQGYIDMAAEQGIDVFITGEVSEQTIHTAREMNINFIAAGHHATERYGAKAVGEYLADTLGLDVRFMDIDNPA